MELIISANYYKHQSLIIIENCRRARFIFKYKEETRWLRLKLHGTVVS